MHDGHAPATSARGGLGFASSLTLSLTVGLANGEWARRQRVADRGDRGCIWVERGRVRLATM